MDRYREHRHQAMAGWRSSIAISNACRTLPHVHLSFHTVDQQMHSTRSYFPVALVVFMLASCAEPVESEVEEEMEVRVDSPIGHFKGGTMDLWVRDDSTFVLRESGNGTGAASGRFGKWRMLDGRLDLRLTSSERSQYRFVEHGIRRISPEGPAPAALDRTVPDREGQMPLMRTIGAYRYLGGSHAFTPCGTERSFPLAVGTQLEELAKVDAEQPVLLEIDARIAPGPAMAGEGEEEYLWLEGVGPVLPEQRCP